MTKRQAKRAACRLAADLLDRGGDYAEALYDEAGCPDGAKPDDYLRLEVALQELVAELDRRGGR